MQLRDIATLILVVIGCVWALKRPYIGLLTYVWLSIMNPHRLGWGFAYDLPFAATAALATFTGMVLSGQRMRSPISGPSVLLMIFLAWTGATTLNAMDYAQSLPIFIQVFKILLMALVAVALIHTRHQITALIWVLVVSLGFFGVKGGIFTIATGGGHRVWGPPMSFVEGNNELAVALIMTIPLLYYLAAQATRKSVRQGIYVSMGLCALAAIGSQSRGAFLAIAAMSAAMWWRSNNKVTLGILLLVASPLMIAFMPDHWMQRMETIGTYEQDQSAMGRINAWKTAINVAGDRLFGAGFASDQPIVFSAYAPDPNWPLVAHSIYFQVLGQHGYIGLALFLLIWWTTMRVAARAEKRSKGIPGMEWVQLLMRMVRVSFVGYLVGGAFLNLAFHDLPYFMMVIVIAVHRLVKEASPKKLPTWSTETVSVVVPDRGPAAGPSVTPR